MVKGGKTQLAKYQWDQIHNPGVVINLFESDDDGKLEAGWWYNPAGFPVYIPAASAGIPVDEIAAGTKINGIIYGWDNYTAKIQNGKFYGYYKHNNGVLTNEIYEDKTVSQNQPNTSMVVMLLNYKGNCVSNYERTIYTVPSGGVPTLQTYRDQGVTLVTAATLPQRYRMSPNPIARENVPAGSGCKRPSVTRVANFTGLPANEYDALLARVKTLLKADDANPLTGRAIQLNALLVLSTDAPNMVQQAGLQVPERSEALIWFHYVKATDKIELRKIQFGADMDAKMQKALTMFSENMVTTELFNSIVNAAKNPDVVIDKFFSAAYQTLDYISNIIEKAKIPAEVYDCSKPGYNPFYAKVLFLTTGNAPVVLWTTFKVNERIPEFNGLTGQRLVEMQFAFLCGTWNGLVGVVQSIPDLLKIVVAPLSSQGRSDINKSITKFQEMEIKEENGTVLCGKADNLCKIWELVKSIPKQFDLSNASTQCIAAHGYGEILGPVAVMCLGDVAAGSSIVSTVFKGAANVIKWCDKVTDVLGYATKLTPNFVKKASGKYAGQLMVVVKQGTSDFVEQVSDLNAAIKMSFRQTGVPSGFGFEIPIEKIDQFFAAMKNKIDAGQATFEWEGKTVDIPAVFRTAKVVLRKISYNLTAVKDALAVAKWTDFKVTADGITKIYKKKASAGRTEADHIATLHDDRLEVHEIDQSSADRVDVSSLDENGNAIGLKAEGENCGVFINGRWACFTGETLVHTEGGTKPIKNIQQGDRVWSYDVAKGQKMLSKVVNTTTSVAKRLIKVFVGKDTLQATDEHPFYANKQWTAAKDLRKGVTILMLSGLMGAVDSIAHVDTLVTTYNFEVAETHNYFVGTKGVLVHNDCIEKYIVSISSSNIIVFNKFVKKVEPLNTVQKASLYKRINNLELSNQELEKLIDFFVNDDYVDIAGNFLKRLSEDTDDFKGFMDIFRTGRGEIKAASNSEPINPILNGRKLFPHAIYKVGDYTYKTDVIGRVFQVSTTLKKSMTVTPRDHSYNVNKRFKIDGDMDAITGDNAGHLIGAQFYGPKERINFVAMRQSLNQNPGDWYKMEAEWKMNLDKADQNYTIEVKILLRYPNNSSLRPEAFQVEYTYPGLQLEVKQFNN